MDSCGVTTYAKRYNTIRSSGVAYEPENKVTIRQDGYLGKWWDSHYNLATID